VVNVTDVYVGDVREVVRTRMKKKQTVAAAATTVDTGGEYVTLTESVTLEEEEPEKVPASDSGSVSPGSQREGETESTPSGRKFNRIARE
jgi:hypothetical protein